MIETEQAICDRLEPLRRLGLTVRALPDQAQQQGSTLPNGSITVSWTLDEPQPPRDTQGQQQIVVRNWMIAGRIRNLRSTAGILQIKQLLYRLIIGYRPPASGPLYARRFELLQRTDTYWPFELQVAAQVVEAGLGQAEPGEIGALLAEVIFDVPEISDRWGINNGPGDI